MKRAAFVVLGSCCLFSMAAASQMSPAPTDRVCFIDEAVRDPTLIKFRNDLLEVVRARDLERLRPMIADDVYLEKGVYGRERLVRQDRLADPKSRSWSALEGLLKLGGRFDGKAFCAPYTGCPSPPLFGGSGDVVILGEDVPAYEQPSVSARVIARLSCNVLNVMGGPEAPTGWWSVPIGKAWGYVQDEKVRWVALEFVYIEKRNGRWLVTKYSALD